MTTDTRPGPRGRLRPWAVVSVTVLALWTLTGCEPDTRSPMAVEKVNRARAAAGMGPLVSHPDLALRARAHAAQMRDAWVAAGCGPTRPHLRHSSSLVAQYRPEEIVGDWAKVGENVGVVGLSPGGDAASVNALHDAYMASPTHRANILGQYSLVGIGTVTGPTAAQLAAGACPGTAVDSVVWNTQAFVK